MLTEEQETAYSVGIHPGIPFDEYVAINAVNHSTLKLFSKTAAHARSAMAHPQETTASLRTGDAGHVAILEPKRFKAEYARSPKFDMRTNKGKAKAAEWAEKYPDYASLLPSEYDRAVGMRDAVWAHPLASELLGGKGQNEITCIWTDAESGLLCKGLIDRFTTYRGWTVVLDIKSARDGSVEGFVRACAQYAYHAQAAFYLDGLGSLADHERRFIHLVVENQPPYCVSLMELDESAIEEGRARYRAAMDKYAAAKETGEYPGYPIGIEGIDIPRWAYEYTRPPR